MEGFWLLSVKSQVRTHPGASRNPRHGHLAHVGRVYVNDDNIWSESRYWRFP